MSRAKGLLKRFMHELTKEELCSVPDELQAEIKELLAQPEQTKRSPLTEAEISKTLKLSRRSTEWDYGFEAGVRFAEEFHGIEL